MRKIALVRHEGSHLQALFLLAFSFIFGRGGEKKKKSNKMEDTRLFRNVLFEHYTIDTCWGKIFTYVDLSVTSV